MSVPNVAVTGTADNDVAAPNGNQQRTRGFHQYTLPNFRTMAEGEDAMAFGGALQVGNWQPYQLRKFANPAPLGLCAFALTTFVLSALNMHARNTTDPHIMISLAFAYGGLVQLLAGMWEMATGNTFGATALSSYGGFWISYAIILTPGFHTLDAYTPGEVSNVLGFYLMAFLFLACEQLATNLGNTAAATALQKTGGLFGFLAAFLAWYNALADIQDTSNSFFQVPVIHFPWSDHAVNLRKQKSTEHQE